jgi:hypothetical protein
MKFLLKFRPVLLKASLFQLFSERPQKGFANVKIIF